MQRTEYKNVFAISQSAMKAFRKKTLHDFHNLYINQIEDDEDDSDYAFGSLADTLAFQPELMDERFYIPEHAISIPGDKVKIIVDKVYKEASKIVETKMLLNEKGNLPEPIHVPSLEDLYDWEDVIMKYAKEIKYGGDTWSRPRILDKVVDEGQAYFRMMSNANGRYIISSMDNADAIEVVDNLRKDINTRKYFVQQEGETLLFQQEIFVDHIYQDNLMIPLKGALDIIHFDHKKRTVRVVDLKTTHTCEFFPKIAKELFYIVQVSFYQYILSEWLKTYEEGKYAGYEFEIPINIAIDRRTKIPYIYQYFAEDLEIAEYGSKEKNIQGWRETLDTISWHVSTGIWDRSRELYENGFIRMKIYK